MSEDAWTGQGYSVAPSSGGGLFFRLKDKGETARMRLVSEAFRYLDTIEDNGETKELKKVAWVVILKEVPAGSKEVKKRVVIFQGGPQIYGHIRTLMDTEDWSNPLEYDISVTRTEETPNFYTVTPHPKPVGPISKDDAAMVEEAGIDLAAIIRKQMISKGLIPGPDVAGAADDEERDVFAED